MGEHDALWVASCAAGVNDAGTHARLLLLDATENGAVLDLRAQLHDLAPVEDLDASLRALERDSTTSLSRHTLGEEETGDDAGISKLVLVAIEEACFQAFVRVANDDACASFAHLFEAGRRTVCHVGVSEDTVGEDGTHDRS